MGGIGAAPGRAGLRAGVGDRRRDHVLRHLRRDARRRRRARRPHRDRARHGHLPRRTAAGGVVGRDPRQHLAPAGLRRRDGHRLGSRGLGAVGAALAQAPAVWVVLGVALLLLSVRSRWAVAGWAVLAVVRHPRPGRCRTRAPGLAARPLAVPPRAQVPVRGLRLASRAAADRAGGRPRVCSPGRATARATSASVTSMWQPEPGWQRLPGAGPATVGVWSATHRRPRRSSSSGCARPSRRTRPASSSRATSTTGDVLPTSRSAGSWPTPRACGRRPWCASRRTTRASPWSTSGSRPTTRRACGWPPASDASPPSTWGEHAVARARPAAQPAPPGRAARRLADPGPHPDGRHRRPPVDAPRARGWTAVTPCPQVAAARRPVGRQHPGPRTATARSRSTGPTWAGARSAPTSATSRWRPARTSSPSWRRTSTRCPPGLATPEDVVTGARVMAVYTALTRLDWALARVADGEGALAGKFRHPSVAPYIRSMQRQVGSDRGAPRRPLTDRVRAARPRRCRTPGGCPPRSRG